MTHQLTRRRLIILAPGGVLAACTAADQEAILRGISTAGGAGVGGGYTSAEAAEAIRVALDQGIGSAIAQVGRLNGYYRDGRIRIPLPQRLASIQSQLQPLGLSGLLDDLEEQINRGAETAAPRARSIFVDAVRAMSISDAIGIVNGGPTSATDYFERRTTPTLTSLFTPIIDRSLQESGAIRTFDQLVKNLRSIPLAPQLGADAKRDLVTHGVEKGLDGLFYYIGQEEAAIRANPAKRTTEILRKVFG